MASLHKIMREQEDEKLARQIKLQNADCENEEVARRLQEHYGDYFEQHTHQERENDYPLEETDEELARKLQEEFDRIDNDQRGAKDNNDETADDESDDEYYQEPESAFGLSSKMGLNTYKAKKKTNQTGKVFPVKEKGFEYGVILGEFHTLVYCYDGIVRKVYFYAKVRKGARITRGALALLQLRPLPDRTADAVYIYEDEEVHRLYEMGEITQLDPVLHLPPEVLCLIIEYASYGQEATPLSLLSKGWKDMVAFAKRQTDDLNRLKWGNLRHFHNRFLQDKLTGEVYGSQSCGRSIIPSMGEDHFIACGLAKEVLRVAEQVWNELMTWRAQPYDKEYRFTELFYYFEVGIPSLKYRTIEFDNYAITVLITWWTIHKRKASDQRPETIRNTLLRLLRLGITSTLQKYERNLIELNGALTDEQQLQMKAFQQRWQPVLNPTKPIEDLNEESLSIDELLLYE